ncbi:MAG: signal recognition particle-docking protein FtsY [Fibrobacteria bacterium]|nr:signal recognition particle-docking protein FtsY [Fibrobacteria bacterium]
MAFFGKISKGLFKTRSTLAKGVTGVMGRGKLTEETLENLEELLIASDICYEVASEIIDKIRKECLGTFLSNEKLFDYLENFSREYLIEAPVISHTAKPHVIFVLGVNGVGKTTSIAKIANYYKNKGEKVLLAAGDTFRAGAIEQLDIWAKRIGVEIVKHQEKSDAAAVIYDAYAAAKARGYDVMIADTAGRLHTKDNLMEELRKMIRVIKKHGDELPHETLLVIDGNTGQNSIPQTIAFNELHPIDGIVVTKLDGTAKGGSLISTNHEIKIPIRWVGVGEGMNDLIPFSKEEYVKGMFGDGEIDIPLEQQEIKEEFKGLQI